MQCHPMLYFRSNSCRMKLAIQRSRWNSSNALVQHVRAYSFMSSFMSLNSISNLRFCISMFVGKKSSSSRSKPVVADLQGGLKSLKQHIQGQKESRPLQSSRFQTKHSNTPFERMKAGRTSASKDIEKQLQQMLEEHGLHEYWPSLKSRGITTLREVVEMQGKGELEKLIAKPGHRIKMLKQARQALSIHKPQRVTVFDGVFDQQKNRSQFQQAVQAYRQASTSQLTVDIQTDPAPIKPQTYRPKECCYQCLRLCQSPSELMGRQFCSRICVQKFKSRNVEQCSYCKKECVKKGLVGLQYGSKLCQDCRSDYEGLLLRLNQKHN